MTTKVDDSTIGSLGYWVEVIEQAIKSERELGVDELISLLKKEARKNKDVIEATENVVVANFLLYSIQYGKAARKTLENEAEKSKINVQKLEEKIKELEGFGKIEKQAGKQRDVEIESLRSLVKEFEDKYNSQLEIVAQKDEEIEMLRKDDRPHNDGKPHDQGPQVVSHIVNDLQQFQLSPEDFPSLTQSIGTSDIANDSELLTVKRILKIADKKEFSRTAMEFAISCGSRSTSDKDPYDGILKIGGKSWKRSDIAYAIKSSGITVRQFCAAFANLYWNFNLMRSTPPENWRKKGFTEGTKFAAFDFFYAVGSNAAIPTEKDGRVKLIRPPTAEENEANSSMRYADIYQQSQKAAGHVTTSPLYNRGSSYEGKRSAHLIEL
ncbi:coat protein [Rudbeckia citrivirus A]|nr:coat protein [Rudbeckia citrivirus A]